MKKIYLLLIALAFVSVNSNAQLIEDDFEFYVAGSMGNQNPTVWRTWSGDFDSGEDIEVVFGVANSGDQSGFIGGGGVQDAVLQFGNLTTGTYTVRFQMFVTAGATGYFNVQGEVPAGPLAGVFNSGDIYFNQTGGTPGEGVEVIDTGNLVTFTYPEDTWFPVIIEFDLSDSTYQMSVDGILVHATPTPFRADNTLGGIDFFSVSANTNFFIDDVLFVEGVLSTSDFSGQQFKVYPNPVVDVLNIQSNEAVSKIAVYNVLGQNVYANTPNAISPTVDMSAYKSGIYFVEVTIGNATKTVKVVK